MLDPGTFDLEFFQQSPLFSLMPRRSSNSGAAARPAQRLLQPPAMDRRVVADINHRRNRLSVDHRSRV